MIYTTPHTTYIFSTPASSQQPHVHFDDTITLKDEFETENSVTYQQAADGTLIVHLGFLQIHHRYLIDLRVPAKWLKVKVTDAAAAEKLRLVSDGKYAANVHCKLVDFQLEEADESSSSASSSATNKKDDNDDPKSKPQQQAFCIFKVEYFAHDERLLKEELKMVSSRNEQDVLKFVITARVLGRGKGTPMLRHGIHCIGDEDRAEGDSSVDSDASASGSSKWGT